MYTELRTPKGRILLAAVHLSGLLISASLLILGEISVLPEWLDDHIRPICYGIFTAFLASALGFTCLCFLKHLSGEQAIDAIGVLSTHQTKEAHKRALSTATFWTHDGHFGNWVRSNVLPKFSQKAIESSSQHRVYFLILDPRHENLINMYVNFRNGFKHRQHYSKWTSDYLKVEIFTTILMAGIYDANDSFLECKVWFRNDFIAYRSDQSSDIAFITSVDPTAPCVAHIKGSAFYSLMEHQFKLLTNTGSSVDYAKVNTWPESLGQIDTTWVLNTLKKLDIGDNIEEAVAQSVAKKILTQGLP